MLRRQISGAARIANSPSQAPAALPLAQLTDGHVTETAVLASELEQLPDLGGYLKTASSATWWKVKSHEALAMRNPPQTYAHPATTGQRDSRAMRAVSGCLPRSRGGGTAKE